MVIQKSTDSTESNTITEVYEIVLNLGRSSLSAVCSPLGENL